MRQRPARSAVFVFVSPVDSGLIAILPDLGYNVGVQGRRLVDSRVEICLRLGGNGSLFDILHGFVLVHEFDVVGVV